MTVRDTMRDKEIAMRTLRVTVLALGMAAAGGLTGPLAGCGAGGRLVGLDESMRVESGSAYVGAWASADGAVRLGVARGAARSLVLTVERDGQPRQYPAHVLDVDGASIAEILVHSPREGVSDAPVYMYGRLAASGDRLAYRPLSSAWLRAAAAREPGVRFQETGEINPGSAGLAAPDRRVMRRILGAAVADAAAFGPEEVFTRTGPGTGAGGR